MNPEDDWYENDEEDDEEEAESDLEGIRSVPLYDDEGNEIPEDELPWNVAPDEVDPNDASEDWQYDDADVEDDAPVQNPEKTKATIADDRPASERRKRVAQSVREEALRRLELSAHTTSDYQAVVSWYDREEQSRMRKERRYESLRGDTPLEYDALPDGDVLPGSMSQPTFKQICRGEFDDFLANCLFEMHDLTDKDHLREIVMNLKLDHKEIVYFLGIRLYPTKKLAALRGQSERNIRKVRDTVRRRIHRQLYEALSKQLLRRYAPTHQEQAFMKKYNPATKEDAACENDESI